VVAGSEAQFALVGALDLSLTPAFHCEALPQAN
jgi:hypothetical protein